MLNLNEEEKEELKQYNKIKPENKNFLDFLNNKKLNYTEKIWENNEEKMSDISMFL